MKVAEIKDELKKLGLPTTGNKATLEARLEEAKLAEKDGNSEADSKQIEEESTKEGEVSEPQQANGGKENENQDADKESLEDQDKNNVSESKIEEEVVDPPEIEKNAVEVPDKEEKTQKTQEESNIAGTNLENEPKKEDVENSRNNESSENLKRKRSDSAREAEDAKLYIGNLAFRTDERELEYHFKDFGKISDIFIPKERYSRKNRGFGFVTFATHEEADKAVNEMNGVELDGRTIRVEFANKKRSRPSYSDRSSSRGYRDSRPPPRREYSRRDGGGRRNYYR